MGEGQEPPSLQPARLELEGFRWGLEGRGKGNEERRGWEVSVNSFHGSGVQKPGMGFGGPCTFSPLGFPRM